ncbi:cysteine--tRNA ligase [Methanocella conradii]|uniref:cysteine--tRNA ligase n=1 Tax=Methanocella conradii TaxID=1175444 RepID=UPI0024B372BF|nr:cysteine--tRNA ligase [Methanocella conradii]MDI6896210.1 cysteine--tRNA ligase [Methanocella conradii]
MALKFYNTLTSKIEDFVPINDKEVKMYVCGPTVYDYCHMGHARAYVVFDTIRRYLQYKGYKVTYVQNFTDIDDKILRRAAELNVPPLELAEKFIEAYFEDMDRLNILRADYYPRVSQNIPSIIKMIEALVDKGYAYVSDGSVYFSVDRMADKVGVLSHQSYDALKVGARVEVDERKRNPMDFVLWKASKPGEAISWDSPWGPGRPGWHIECSAMSLQALGPNIDIHGGGMDLIFPHHESEIMQTEAYTGKPPFARYWIHNGFMLINKEKMSKSLGNFFLVRDVLKIYSPDVVRLFILNTHYQSPLDFSDAALDDTRRGLERIRNALAGVENRLRSPLQGATRIAGARSRLEESRKRFEERMDDNLDTREAIAEIFELTRDVNRWLAEGDMPAEEWREVLDLYGVYSSVLGIKWSGPMDGLFASELLQLIVEIRDAVRKKKDYETSDMIRKRLKELGIAIEDTKEGTKIKRI